MKRLIFSLVVATFVFVSPAGAAEKFPSKALEFVSTGSPGSGMSLYSQTVAQILSGILKVPVNVVHKSAGNSAQAIDYLMSRPADGYTMVNLSSAIATYMHFKHFRARPNDLYFLCELQKTAYSFVVLADGPINTIQDLIDFAKKNPGQLEVGSAKLGSPQHMHVMNFANAAGIDVNYVPYGGTGETLKDVLGGHLRVGLVQPFLVMPHVAAGKIRILLNTSENRLAELPDVPVPADIGLNYPFYHQTYGVALKAGTPPERLAVLDKAFKELSEHPEYKAYTAQSVGMTTIWKNHEEYTTEFMRNHAITKELIEKYNLDRN